MLKLDEGHMNVINVECTISDVYVSITMNLNDVYKQNHFHFHTYTSTYTHTHTHIQNYLHWENICIQKLLIF